ncbi:HAF repeat-containing protein [Pseudoduganella sp. CY13W]|uniref:HAF repeat-containing protein n=2 Tax=Duganella qianjiadongensis TaxID=2692176 RepID=A0ABW9VHX2_9BURK|nr:HAF repeat-containing protein [Duganella qianjiadongensis]
MLRTASSVILAAVLIGHAGISAAEKIHPLGIAVKNEEASIAVDINARGQVAGIIQNVEQGTQRAILYDRQLIELGTLGGEESYTKGINASGTIVGTAQNQRRQWRAFIYSKAGGMRDLGTLGGNSSYGAAINTAGQVVGFADTSDNYFHAFVSNGEGELTDLGTLGGNISYASSINNHGEIAGTAALSDGYRRAFLYRPGSGMINLGTLPGGRASSASAINDEGIVVGAASTASGRWHAFMYDGTEMVDLGNMIGYGDSYATGVNGAGHVVGTILIGDERRSFVYRDGKMTVHPGGHGLYLVNAINNQELVIGAQYQGRKFEASTMRSNAIATVVRSPQEFMTMICIVLLAAGAAVIYHRRYRGIQLGGRNMLAL